MEDGEEIFTGHYNFIRKLLYLLLVGEAQQQQLRQLIETHSSKL